MVGAHSASGGDSGVSARERGGGGSRGGWRRVRRVRRGVRCLWWRHRRSRVRVLASGQIAEV